LKTDNVDHVDHVEISIISKLSIISTRPLQPARWNTRSGVALVVTLGILAMICVAVIAFIAAMRLERSTARLEADRATLRSLHPVALASAMRDVTWQLYERVYPIAWWDYDDDADDTPQPPPSAGACLGSFYRKEEGVSFPATSIKLFTGAATNLVPGAVHSNAAAVESIWVPVTSVFMETPEPGDQTDPLAPLMDTVVMSRVAYLIIDCSGFLPPMSTNALEGSTRYAAQIHLPPERRDHTFYLAHDPDPEQFYTIRPEFATNPAPYPGLFSTLVTNKFDVNSWTNDLVPAPANGETPLAYDPASSVPWLAADTLEPWFVAVARGFAESGFLEDGQAKKLTWNLINLLDEDRIPQTRPLDGGPFDRRPPSRITYGFENLPMINEVAVSDVAAGAEYPAYSVSVELWYPFEPEQSPEGLVLAVGVYTNSPPLADVPADPFNAQSLGPFGFTNVIPLLYSPGRMFHVAFSTPIRFAPVVVDPEDLDDYALDTHPLYIWPRLYLLCTNTTSAGYVCVDEAMIDIIGNVDNIDNIDNFSLLKWTAPGSWEASNPFFNLLASAGDFGDSSTLWARNANLDPGFEYPLFHLNRPMLSAGELGYLGLAQAGTGTVALATAEGAALLDRFTTLPTNRLEKASDSRIQPNSPYPDVIEAFFRDPVFSRPIAPEDAPTADTLTNAWFEARTAWTNARPGASWNTFADLLPALAPALDAALREASIGLEEPDPEGLTDVMKMPRTLMVEDLLRGIADQATFRQNLFVIIVAAQRLSPPIGNATQRVLADQRAAITVIRDAYTGRWGIHDWCPLPE